MKNWWGVIAGWITPVKRARAEHLRTGLWGENTAADFLRRKGYRVLGRRVKIGRRDEIDLVMSYKGVLIFVEVKTRRAEKYGRPLDAVNKAKRFALSRAAVRYLKRLHDPRVLFRFDVVEVVGSEHDPIPPVVRHVENAFRLDPRYRIC